MVVWEGGREGLGFRGLRQGVRGLRRGTKGSRGFSEQGHQAKAQMNQSPPAKLSRVSEPLQSSGAVCKPQIPSTHTHPPKPHTERPPIPPPQKKHHTPWIQNLIQLSDFPLEAQGSKYRSSKFILCSIPNVNSQSMWVLFPNRAKVMGKAGTQILGRLTEG